MSKVLTLLACMATIAPASCRTAEITSDLQHGGHEHPRKGPFALVGAERIEKKVDGIHVVYKAPCKALIDETLVVSSPYSGVEGYDLGVVYNTTDKFCAAGPAKEFHHVIPKGHLLFDRLNSASAKVKGLVRSDYTFTPAHYISRSVGKRTAVIFNAPCKELNFDVMVGSVDSSGDKVLSVGVVYPKAHCTAGDVKKINRFITLEDDPETFARLGGGDTTLKRVEPMLVEAATP